METTRKEDIIYWHLPGLCYFRALNQVLMNLMKDYPEHFREGYRIGSVYGTVPGAVWNGGRAVFGFVGKGDIQRVLDLYNSRGIPARFTWTNSLLEEKHLQDTYCNLIMRLGDNGLNQVLVNRDVLEDYIRREYPGYRLISSTTKRVADEEGLRRELEKDYFLVVLDYDLNKNWELLEKLGPAAGKVEILVNEICAPGCALRREHYRQQSHAQLEYDPRMTFQCPHRSGERTFAQCRERPSFISNQEIGRYIRAGYRNFKIVGRGLPGDFVKESYLYFLAKEESVPFLREKMEKTLAQLARAGQTKTR